MTDIIITKRRRKYSSESSSSTDSQNPKPKKKSSLLDGYKTYDDSMGRGNPDEWKATFFERMGIIDATRIMGADSPLAELGIFEPTTLELIRSAFRKLAKELHPDVNSAPDATIRMQRLNAAMTILEEKYK